MRPAADTIETAQTVEHTGEADPHKRPRGGEGDEANAYLDPILYGVAPVDGAFFVRTGTARRQLRWILWGTALGAAPFSLAYALPWATGVSPTLPMELTAVPLSLVPLAFASAIVRYRLMDVEVIIKRGLVWTAAVSATLAIYAILLRGAGTLFLADSHQYNSVIAMLATLVVVLLARPVKSAMPSSTVAMA